MLKRLHCITRITRKREAICCLQMGPVVLWGIIGSGKLLYGVVLDKLQKLLKENAK